jgi:hypothetical protein
VKGSNRSRRSINFLILKSIVNRVCILDHFYISALNYFANFFSCVLTFSILGF